MVYRSRDLKTWARPTSVFTVPADGWADDEHAWAPEVHEYRGAYYLFVTLHNSERFLARPPQVPRDHVMRSTVIARSETPDGPFHLLKHDRPVAPEDLMTIDGTLYVDPDGTPWMVYVHEWIQIDDGTMEALPLKDDLSDAAGDPIHLFKASEGSWPKPSAKEATHVTDGPQLFTSRTGHLLMLWASFEAGRYLQTLARSKSGRLEGPWEQLDPLVREHSGHGMSFRTFEGELMLILHGPNHDARGKLYEMHDAGDRLLLERRRTDLDGGSLQSP